MTVMTPNCNGVENSSLLTKWMLEQNTPNFQTKCPLHRTQIQIQNIEKWRYLIVQQLVVAGWGVSLSTGPQSWLTAKLIKK